MSHNQQKKLIRYNFPVWQITLPLCGVLIFAIGAITTIYMINGRYLFHLKATPKGLEIMTDVDKREIKETLN
ncbi:MAG: hypothetical protein F6K63_20970 [Moorea sp. SIO1G6]|uniref:hypothetical protein n=1 Tax=unclassified Moorena TaxID=2683338 RepID=UPI0013BE4CB5|nr:MULTISPECIES: hypothetical protein [unclassified Moorena]NEQ08311.1 hypothetical protein [Moorena sp. SIO4E2]NET66725.1 hypothetical protein [Moorena sp. SIO1G6]